MTFEAYLSSKNINSEVFRLDDETHWSALKATFDQLHPDSFTMQKKFLINGLRKKYPLVDYTTKSDNK